MFMEHMIYHRHTVTAEPKKHLKNTWLWNIWSPMDTLQPLSLNMVMEHISTTDTL